MKKSLPADVIVPGLPRTGGLRARRSGSVGVACAFRMTLALCGFGAVLLSASHARADCQPNSPVSGQTVTCTGIAPTGFQVADPTVNNLTVNVVPGAIVQDNGSIAILVNNFNTITNSGAVIGGVGVFGINAIDNNTIINNGTISIGDGGVGIIARNQNVILNAGAIAVGDGGFGIVTNNRTAVTNSGTISLGDFGTGIELVGNRNSATNNGTISGNTIIGIDLSGSTNSLVTNNGSILSGNDSAGINATSATSATIVNNGVIGAGSALFANSAGIAAGFRNTVTNNGTISVGNDAFGIVAFNSSDTIVNNGTITAGAGVLDYSAGIDVSFSGSNLVTNNGRITVGANGIGINTGDSNTITNNGTIVVGDNGTSIGTCGCVLSTNNTVTNNGTLDGRVNLDSGGGPGNTFVNAGLITITDTGTPVGANHIIDGTFTQTASGTLALRVNNAGVSDFLSNSGAGALTATLGGKLGAVVQPGLYANSTTYIGVLSATDPITTQFSQVQAFAAGTTAPLAFFTATATYNPTSVDLTLTRIGFGAVPGETFNERAVGNALNALYSTSLSGNQALFFSNLLQATSTGILDQISGEGTSATQQTAFSAAGTFLTAMMDQGNFWLSGDTLDTNGTPFTAMNYAPSLAQALVFKAMPGAALIFEPRWRAWTAGFDTATSVNADISTGAASSSFRTAGGIAGFDVQVTPDLLLGAAAGGSASNFSVDACATSGRLDGAHVGVYGVARNGQWYAEGALSYANFDTATTRTAAGVGAAEILNGHFDSNLFNGRFEGGYRLVFGSVAVTPFAAIEFAELWQPGYVETNPAFGAAPLGLFGLTYAARTVSSLPTFLGAQFDTHTELPNGWIVSPYLRLSWLHEFEPNRNIAASFIVLPGSDFTVDGPRAAADAARINAGIRLAVAHNISLFASVTGEFSDRSDMYAGKGGLKVYW